MFGFFYNIKCFPYSKSFPTDLKVFPSTATGATVFSSDSDVMCHTLGTDPPINQSSTEAHVAIWYCGVCGIYPYHGSCVVYAQYIYLQAQSFKFNFNPKLGSHYCVFCLSQLFTSLYTLRQAVTKCGNAVARHKIFCEAQNGKC